jgi:hypothetical protein
MAGESQAVDEACTEIAEAAFDEGSATMLDMCGNNGQVTIIGNALGDYAGCAEAAQQGDFEEFSTDHDDAVGMIVEVGNGIMAEAAAQCAQIRAAGDVASAL